MLRSEYIGALVFTNRFLGTIDPTKLGSDGYKHTSKVLHEVLDQMKEEMRNESKIKK